ncbi:hypothetical protein JANAI62_25190 [Jannaschia pagri]|uniref:Uncharacterized protein n=1 Tax=Jannaschia pagri TaxID=2829797 RepID=A0ABQ4NNH5_9RHOB|nr:MULTISPECIES: hypothetical protein [unclassified Jannaschia]GIT92061.1 hypothetical protein JANAI61_25190 [Jannaschia sp. AI_61]GIT95896.1 hypothetical protein JANAI62_25190 [Jannaschia sp. AI_62]
MASKQLKLLQNELSSVIKYADKPEKLMHSIQYLDSIEQTMADLGNLFSELAQATDGEEDLWEDALTVVQQSALRSRLKDLPIEGKNDEDSVELWI